MKRMDNEALLAKFNERLAKNQNYKKSKFGNSKQFTIAHYASDVTYRVDNFL